MLHNAFVSCFMVSLCLCQLLAREAYSYHTISVFMCGYVPFCVCLSVSPFFQPSYVCNAWTYFSETHCSGSSPGPRDIDDIFKFMGSKVAVTEILWTAEEIWTKTGRNTYCSQNPYRLGFQGRGFKGQGRRNVCRQKHTGQHRRPFSHKCKICIIPW